ncbi:carbohydrate-binding protein [Lederbergia sp. NSJ-179]|uniref:carbohydrate-binding protein n=1 Tax=Lederbergia sp. NSJ-179 TaxID=2931402 RepID=UPI001FD40385|nr:carbohydrate-binding protein [Lederbergia sp. NSJ-179]MCJ7842891.1 carbohydrate-binding protein [Lederbergia sp. NSJ-179]
MWFLRLLLVLGGLFIFPGISFAYSNPFDLSDSWEWDNGDFYGEGDPYILKYNGTYYLYVSTVDDKSGVKAWTSEDLINWEYAGLVTEEPSTKAAYAPEVTYWNGAFYMYTSPGGNGHYVYKSTSPLGPFVKQTENLGMGIDGHVFIDDDGQWYFYGTGSNNIRAYKMEDPYTFGSAIDTGAEMSGWTEAPTVFKRHGQYYMTYVGNHVWSKAYRINYATSDSPMKNFKEKPLQNPILLKTEGENVGLGHNGIVRGPDLDSEYIVYHSHANPGRYMNMDRIAWNGEKMTVLGPTTFEQENPGLPDFSDRFKRKDIGAKWSEVNGGAWSLHDQSLEQKSNNDTIWHRLVTTYETENDYTAEFNMTLMNKGEGDNPRYGTVFSYQDEDNYGVAVLSLKENKLETNFFVDGVEQGWEKAELPTDFDFEQLHQIRVEKEESKFTIFVDGMHKQTRNVHSLNGGKIGYTTSNVHASFGYIATSNKVNGSNVFDFHKPLPGKIEAVHYNSGGEGTGYHQIDRELNHTYREDEVDIRPNSEGGYRVNLAKKEWLHYNVNVDEEGKYSINLRIATEKSGVKLRLSVDDEADLTGIFDVPNTDGEWQNLVIENVSLPKGKHKMKVEVVQGSLSFAGFEVSKYKDVPILFEDFNDGFDSGWNRYEGYWKVDTNQDSISVFDGFKPIPGDIQAAYYITGGEGVAYHDTTPENIGGVLRDDAVDIRDKPGGGTAVGWNQTGEWLKYNVDIQDEGIYNLEMEYGTTFKDAKVRFWLDDNIDLTGIVDVPATEGWNDWQTLRIKDIQLPKGKHTLKIEIVKGEFDISKFHFRTFDIHKPIPGLIEAEDYNLGGEGTAYHVHADSDTDEEFRKDGIDIKPDPEGGYAINELKKGEWIKYNVNISESRKYDLDFIVNNSDENTKIGISLDDGTNLTESVNIPATDGKKDWENISIPDLELPQGKHTLKIEVIDGELSFTKMIFHTFGNDHNLPGKIMAVDYMLGGEGTAYHDKTPENIGRKYRYDGVDIRNHPDGSFNIGWNQTGEWYKYNVDIATSGKYVLDMNIATNMQDGQVRLWLDDEIDLTGVIDIPQTGEWDNWSSVIKENISLPAGKHTIKVETVKGEFDFHYFSFHEQDEYQEIEREGVYRSGAGTFGKSVIGDRDWHNYIVEADVQVVDGKGDGGILFRVNNPAHGKELNHNNADMLQGYVAYINKDGVHLGKFNYNWTYLEGSKLDDPIDEWQHMKVVVNGTNIKIYVGDMDKPKIDYDDHSATAFIHGKVGVRSFYSDTKYDNIFVRPLEPSINDMLTVLQDHQDDLSEKDYRSLKVHLTAVGQFEKKGTAEKVIKHMESFKQLLDYQLKNERISKELYAILTATTNSLVEKWESK